MKGVRVEDLPTRLQDQVRAKLGMAPRLPVVAAAKEIRAAKAKQPTKTEQDYARTYLAGVGARYEALTFKLANGHRYTPDWTWWGNDRLYAVEVKGSYRLGSYQRARLAFDQARIEFPHITWIWAEKKQDKTWITQ